MRSRMLNWLVGSDPGLLRLHSTIRTTVTLAVALVILVVLSQLTGGPVTAAMLGVVVAMQAAMTVNEPERRGQLITTALLPIPAGVALTIAALLSSRPIVNEVVFVLVIFVAAMMGRFGGRGTALGMVGFISYFFALFLGAQVGELPDLMGAVVVGAVCALVIRLWVLPDRPERALRYTVWALWIRIAAVIDVSSAILQSGHADENARQRLRKRTAQLNETVVMVEDQVAAGPEQIWPGVDGDELILRLFDAELAVERVALACVRAAEIDTPPELVEALAELSAASSGPPRENLAHAMALADEVLQRSPAPEVQGLVLAVFGMADAVVDMRALINATATPVPLPGAADEPETDDADDEATGLHPSTRHAIQATVAATLAIVVGELVSPTRWYWAVITAFLVFAGASSRGEILTKGWQRVFGTLLGIPAGVVVAAVVSGHQVAAVLVIFACLFLGFYFQKVSYSVMMFCITTMLALLYGLMGQFSIGVLMLRLEETAVGAVIGVAVAALVLPTKTLATARTDADAFLATLAELVDAAVTGNGRPTELARRLHRELHQVRISTKPLVSGIFGIGGRGSVQRGVRLLGVCDYHGRALARSGELGAAPAAEHFARAAAMIRANIVELVAWDSDGIAAAIEPLDAAEVLVQGRAQNRMLFALRAIDGALVNLAIERDLAVVA